MPPESLGPVRRLGRYALYREIAAGGMASVHIGRLLGPVGFSRTVAVKRLHPHFAKDPEFVAMFLDEARLAAAIQHPNVVPILDVVATDGELFLVMEYVQGASLSQLTRIAKKQGVKLPRRIASAILVGALHGLHAAHEAKSDRNEPLNLIHRDVSPQNVLVGVDGVARVLDFGVAKAARRIQETESGRLKGKFSYMAPEQIRHDRIDRRVDVFAAGIVLWEVLTGQRLFTANEPGRIMAKILEGGVPRLAEHARGLPNAVQSVVDRALAQDPDQRFATAREMAIALEKALPPVLQREVGEWVEQVAGELLDERATLLAEIQSQPEGSRDPRASLDELARMLDSPVERTAPLASSPPSGNTVTVKTPADSLAENSGLSGISATSFEPAPRLARRSVVPIVTGITVGALMFVVFAMSRLGNADAPIPKLRGAMVIPSITLADPVNPPQSSAPTPELTPPPKIAPEPAPSAAPPRRKVVRSTPSPQRPRAECEPPYTVTAKGVKRFKPQCL